MHFFPHLLRCAAEFFKRGGLRIGLVLLSGAVVHGQGTERRSFDLPSDVAERALKRFSEQSGRTWIADGALLRGVRTAPVAGEMTPKEAIERMLVGTNLTAIADRETDSFSLQRAAPAAAAPTPRPPGSRPAELVAAAREEVVTLSPFEVSTNSDVGYSAAETLAGTRLRTDLRDVGAPLVVLTEEFLRDLAATDIVNALLFTPSVDTWSGANDGGVANISGEGARWNDGQSFSLRGFATGGVGADFFSSPPADVYNIDRATLSRGPNSLLFGVGGPAGAAVTSIKRPLLNQTKTQVQVATDRWSSRRLALDHNQPLKRGVAAVRFNALWDDKREFRPEEGVQQERYTGSAQLRPAEHTTLTLTAERYRYDANVVPMTGVFERDISRWIAAGRPTIGFVEEGRLWTVAGRTYLDAQGRPVPVARGVNDADGFVDQRTDFDPNAVLLQRTANSLQLYGGAAFPSPIYNTRWMASQGQINRIAGVNENNIQLPNSLERYGIPYATNLMLGNRRAPANQLNGFWVRGFAEQRLAPDLYLELAANLGESDNNRVPGSANRLSVDVDRYLPDGTPNPGYLQLYNQLTHRYQVTSAKTMEYRATLSYELDLEKRRRWLGSHRLSGMAEYDVRHGLRDDLAVYNRATVGLTGFSADASAALNQVTYRNYLVDGQVNYPLNGPRELAAQIAALNARGRAPGVTAADAVPLDLALRPDRASGRSRSTQDGASFGWQSRWWQGRLVGLFGYRSDNVTSYAEDETFARQWADPAVAGSATDPLRRYYTLAKDLPLNPKAIGKSHGVNRTFGGVFHALPWLSFTYNRSSNFQPAGADLRNYDGHAAVGSRGHTEDFGLRFSFFQQRLAVSVNRFVTDADQTLNANGPVDVATPAAIIRRLRTNYRDTGDSHFRAMNAEPYAPEDLTTVTSRRSTARGTELSLTFNPTRQWRAVVTASAHDNILKSGYEDYARFLNTAAAYTGLATWRQFASELRKVAAGQRSSAFDLDPANATHRTQASTDAQLIEDNVAKIERAFADDTALFGSVTNRNGKYAVNGVATYTFSREGRLQGWAAGGNFRYRSRNIAGYYRSPLADGSSPEGEIDPQRPIAGEPFWDAGAMLSYSFKLAQKTNVRLQLNVENLFGFADLRLVRVDSDTDGLFGAKYAYAPLTWELRRPRNYRLTATFDF